MITAGLLIKVHVVYCQRSSCKGLSAQSSPSHHHCVIPATGLHPIRLVDSLCSYSPLAFLHPGSVESRLGLVAKLARIDRSQAVQLVSQHPQLWMINSRLLGPRWACIKVIQRVKGASGIPQHIATMRSNGLLRGTWHSANGIVAGMLTTAAPRQLISSSHYLIFDAVLQTRHNVLALPLMPTGLKNWH